MKTRTLIFGAVLASAAMTLTGPANATLMIVEGVFGGSGDVENVLYNGANDVLSGMTVTGHTNQTDLLVDFTGDVSLSVEGGGQDRIIATADVGNNDPNNQTGFDNVTINLQDTMMGFGKLQFAIDILVDGSSTGNNDGELTITVIDQFGASFAETFAIDTSGQQFYTVYSLDSQVAVSANIDANNLIMSAIEQLQEVRVGPADLDGGPGPEPMPEPGTLGVLGIGLAGLGWVVRRRRKAA